jgi:hypothetical protein
LIQYRKKIKNCPRNPKIRKNANQLNQPIGHWTRV